MENYSVLMSIYAKVRPEELKLSLDSMICQSFSPNQIVLVLDGPIGDTLLSLIKNYETANLGLFDVIQLPTNMGLAYALNVGLANCKNDLIARMDSDDYSTKDRCLISVRHFENDDELKLLGVGEKHFVDNIDNIVREIGVDYEMEEIKTIMRRNDPFSHPGVMFRKSAVLECGGYDSALRRRQDYDLFSKMVNGYNFKSKIISDKLLYFRSDREYWRRNKNWQSCKMRIAVQNRIYKRGECNMLDLLYVTIAMMISFVIPTYFYEKLYKLIKRT